MNLPKTIFRSLSFLAFVVLLFGCAHTSPPSAAPAASPANASKPAYERQFDAWYANGLSVDLAEHGDRDAQIAFFLSGYVRLSSLTWVVKTWRG